MFYFLTLTLTSAKTKKHLTGICSAELKPPPWSGIKWYDWDRVNIAESISFSQPSRNNCLCLATPIPSLGGSTDRARRSEVNISRCLGGLVCWLRLLVFLCACMLLLLMLVELFEVQTPIFGPHYQLVNFHLLGWYETRLECHSRFFSISFFIALILSYISPTDSSPASYQ